MGGSIRVVRPSRLAFGSHLRMRNVGFCTRLLILRCFRVSESLEGRTA